MNDLSNYNVCDDHETAFLKGDNCPECLAEQDTGNKHTTYAETYKISFASGKVLRGTVGNLVLSDKRLCRITDDRGDEIHFMMRNVDCVTIHMGDPDA